MANKMPFGVLTSFGASGSAFGSETTINVAAGPNYLSASTNPTLGLPSWMMFQFASGAVTLQYTPDSGVTWRNFMAGSGAIAYVESTGSWRLFATNAGNVLATQIKQ